MHHKNVAIVDNLFSFKSHAVSTVLKKNLDDEKKTVSFKVGQFSVTKKLNMKYRKATSASRLYKRLECIERSQEKSV